MGLSVKLPLFKLRLDLLFLPIISLTTPPIVNVPILYKLDPSVYSGVYDVDKLVEYELNLTQSSFDKYQKLFQAYV